MFAKKTLYMYRVFMRPELICYLGLLHFNKENSFKFWAPNQIFQKKSLSMVISCKTNLYKKPLENGFDKAMKNLLRWSFQL